jgi:hypothetical protein
MPLVYFKCSKCGDQSRRLFKIVPDYKHWGNCTKCAGHLVRNGTGQSSQVMETLDNGVMRKSVTRYVRAAELMADRAAHADPSKKKTEYV